ncbi:MAG: hypothetical protein F6K00_33475 [Leptolyngbya sp. SIOISBB]|nr:hypothetical protein [Leptolyngbya sp. SIOISBB]
MLLPDGLKGLKEGLPIDAAREGDVDGIQGTLPDLYPLLEFTGLKGAVRVYWQSVRECFLFESKLRKM